MVAGIPDQSICWGSIIVGFATVDVMIAALKVGEVM